MNPSKKRAFTLIEIIVVVVIVAILVAILVPVFARAVHSAQMNASQQRLKQLQLAVEIYRMDYDGVGRYGSMYDAGLPTYGYVYSTHMGFGMDFFVSPCGYKEHIEANQRRLSYQYTPSPMPGYTEHLQKYQEDALLFVDQHCNDPSTDLNNQYHYKRGLGVTLGGRLINRYSLGYTGDINWWMTE